MTATMAALALATPVATRAQYGRLVDPKRALAFFNTACIASAPSFSTRVAAKAKASKWDELGLSRKAKPGDRGWLVSLNGLPAIVDISRTGPVQKCSINLVTDPSQVLALISKIEGRKPDFRRETKVTLEQGWNATKRIPNPLMVTTTPGVAMVRVTMAASK
jgi:hypothetical protein